MDGTVVWISNGYSVAMRLEVWLLGYLLLTRVEPVIGVENWSRSAQGIDFHQSPAW
jgi:hypothetical protein